MMRSVARKTEAGLKWMFDDAAQERARELNQRAQQFIGMPPAQWPQFEVRWDTDPAMAYYCVDGSDPISFTESHPGGVSLLEAVSVQAIYANVTHQWYQAASEILKVGTPATKARIITEWIDGMSLTPALIHLYDDRIHLMISGNHRLAVAQARGVKIVPVWVYAEEESRVREILGLTHPPSE